MKHQQTALCKFIAIDNARLKLNSKFIMVNRRKGTCIALDLSVFSGRDD